jgi:hypothetical protein
MRNCKHAQHRNDAGHDISHTAQDGGYEWFSPEGVMSGSLTFDLGGLYLVDRVAAWADEFAGFGTTNVSTSLDGIACTTSSASARWRSPSRHPMPHPSPSRNRWS